MKNKILSVIFTLALLATAGFGVQKSMKGNAGLSDLALANVEALAQNENGGGDGTLWTREDDDCTYTFTGKAGSQVHFSILGIPISLTIGADGTATYVYGNGKTHCKSGGNEQCTARYCPPLSM